MFSRKIMLMGLTGAAAIHFVFGCSGSRPPSSLLARKATASNDAPASDPTNLATLLESVRTKYDLPALAGAVVSDEKIEALGVVGVRKYDGKNAVTEDDPFHLGSDGKAMTAVVVAKAVDAKKLAWTTTIGQAFSGVPMNAAYEDVTLEDLLAMRGGFPHDPKSISIGELKGLTGPVRSQREIYVAKALLDAPDVTPKTKMSYSNVSYVIAAAMAERAMNASWEDMIASEVWRPLGMQGAGFGAMGSPGKIDALGNMCSKSTAAWGRLSLDHIRTIRLPCVRQDARTCR